jgi:hypothetical protein
MIARDHAVAELDDPETTLTADPVVVSEPSSPGLTAPQGAAS